MSKKILICDDDESISEMIKIMLEERGYEVMSQSNGRGIVKKVKEYLPNLILLDIWMPGVDGGEITKLIKKDDQIKNIPVVIISALHSNEVAKIVKKVGADGYLTKPFDMQDLFSLVNKYSR